MSAYRIALAGQDITAHVDEPTIAIQNSLAGGAGVMSHTSGRAGTCSFEAFMGPLTTAPGNGQFAAPPLRNLLTANQSAPTTTTGFSSATDALVTGSIAVPFNIDTNITFNGMPSLHFNTGTGFTGATGVEIKPGVAIPANTQVTCSYYYMTPTGGGALRAYDFTNNVNVGSGTTLTTPATTWTRAESTFFTGAATNDLRFCLRSSSTNQDFWIAGLQVEYGQIANQWVLGGTEGLGSTLVRQGECIVYDQNNNRIFGGYLTKTDDRTKKLTVKTLCSCVDYWSHLDRVIVTKTYDGVSDTFAINDMLSTYAPWINLSNVNLSVSNITLYQQVYRGKSLQSALQHIADITGFDIWVDEYKNLYYQAPSQDGNAPFSISDTPDHVVSFPAKITQHALDDNSTINRVTFVGGEHPTTDFTQDISTQANGSNTTFKLAYDPHESSDGKIHVHVSGVDLAVGFALTTDQLKSQGGTFDVLVDRSQATLTFNVAPGAGVTVTCTYRYQTPLVVVVTNQPSFAFFGEWFDGLISDSTVQDTATALQRCRTLLAEQAQGLETLQFSTYQPGLQAGMRVLVQNAIRGINDTFRIQQVNTVWLGGGQFRYDVTAGAWNFQVADILLAAARFSQEADNNFDELEVSILAIQGTESVGLHDTWSIKQRLSGYYMARAVPEGDGSDAYPGLFTVLFSPKTEAASTGNAKLGPVGLAGGGSLIATGHVA